MILFMMILIPLVLVAFNLGVWSFPVRRLFLTLGGLAMFGVGIIIAMEVNRHSVVSAGGGLLRADALSAVLLLTVSSVIAATFPYAGGYIEGLDRKQAISPREIRRFHILLSLFAFAAVLTPMLDNMGLMWGAMEGTTLSAALLVAFYRTHEALEAAWKFLLITSLGSLIALIGTLVFYAGAVQVAGSDVGINWSHWVTFASHLPHSVTMLGFLLILIGYGTKAGIMPMHTWMPDAYSRAPSPVCALLSGAELSCAVYMVYRFVPLTEISLNHSFLFAILAGFGLATLIVAAVFVVVQREYKRLLAYSSMEHSALMLLGVAFGGPLGLFGALWQLMTHAVIKSAMFFGAGNVLIHYETNEMDEVKGILRRMPVTGWLWLLCVAAIVGAPPFALFGSDLGILGAAFLRNHWALGGITALLLAMIYITLFYYFVRMIYGHSEAETDANHSDASPWSVIPMFVLVTMALIFGLAIPDGLLHLLKNAAAILQ